MKCDFGNCECPNQDVHRVQNVETGHVWNYHLACLRAFLVMMVDIDREFEDFWHPCRRQEKGGQ